MTLKEWLEILDSGVEIAAENDVHLLMHQLSQEALQITAELNSSYHTPEEIRVLMEKLTGRPIDPTFGLFPRFILTAERTSKLASTSSSTQAANFRIRAESPLTMAH